MKNHKIINDIDGLIIIDKPKDYTSNDCLSIIKKVLHPKKIGHTGTLDTNATGVLVCLLGSATKCQDYLMRCGDKVYDAELILGIATDTEDFLGKVLCKSVDYSVNEEEIVSTLKSFVGSYEQTPPMYSAKKVAGKKLLNLARKGIVVERKSALVNINSIEFLGIEDIIVDEIKCKKVKFIVSCSKGTYIRTLCKDIGDKLNIPACMGNLRRLATGKFKIEDSISIDELKEKVSANDFSFIKPCYYQQDNSVVTFGKFETLHLGHQKIIEEVVRVSKEHKLKSTVLIVGKNEDNFILTSARRISKLKYIGVDNILYFPLNEQNKSISAEDFVTKILDEQLQAKYVIVGSDCRFGYMGTGNSSILKDLCDKLGIVVSVIDKLKVENTDKEISSTLIKEEYENGNIDLVNKLLGKEKL